MDNGLSTLETCLRVLTAFNKREEPDPHDMYTLRSLPVKTGTAWTRMNSLVR